MSGTYDLYIYDISYFSGKMEAYLRYREIPHRRREVRWTELAFELVEEAGVMEVPLVRRPDGVLMRDTSAMIEWFEAQAPTPGGGAVLPEDPALAFLFTLLEDYADEGLWRPALYYRWAFEVDARHYAQRFMDEFLRLPGIVGPLRKLQERNIIARQRRVYLKGEGVTEANAKAVEAHYRDELRDLSALLEGRPYLCGERPCLVDFGYFASMFRHFSIDPTPRAIMRAEAPAVVEWVARMWAARASADGLGERPLLGWDALAGAPALASILARAGRLYLPYLHANAQAVRDGRASFDVILDGERYPAMPAIPFRAWSRRRLIRARAALSPADRARVDALLGAHGCLEPLLVDPDLDPAYPEGDALPRCLGRKVSRWGKLGLLWTGTPHHIETGSPR